ncbi:3-isopropylmalate dehydrogenase [soil metagenome]
MQKTIAVLAGDGIGQEIMSAALPVLAAIENKFQHQFILKEALIGGAAYDQYGCHFPDKTRDICLQTNAILFGSVGGPITESHLEKWQNCERNSILALRQYFTLNANFRPIAVYAELAELSPLKNSLSTNVDMLIVRELVGDIYFGEHKRYIQNGLRCSSDVAHYNEEQIASVAHLAFQAAQKRKKVVTSVDKANVLETSRLWREVVTEISKHYTDVTLQHMLVDNCAMQLIINPQQFDVIVTANLFGDILSDAAAALPGSLGLIPSASTNSSGFGLYEPAGGSAPNIAGKNIANPIAQILSVALMLSYSFALEAEAVLIENAVRHVLQNGLRTKDIYRPGTELVGTQEMGHAIANIITIDK